MILGKRRLAKNILRILDAFLACLAITLAFYLRQAVLAEESWRNVSLFSFGEFSLYTIFWPPLLVLSPSF